MLYGMRYTSGSVESTNLLLSIPGIKDCIKNAFTQHEIMDALVLHLGVVNTWTIIFETEPGTEIMYLPALRNANKRRFLYESMLLLNSNTTMRYYIENHTEPNTTLAEWKTAVKKSFGLNYYNDMLLEISEQYATFYWVYELQEMYMYGSSRLGSVQRNLPLLQQVLNSDSLLYYSYANDSIRNMERGQKRFELSNHLGNLLAVVSDRKLVHCSNDELMWFEAQVVSVTDYYPFGMEIKERTYVAVSASGGSAGSYRYGFNGQEKDDEVKGSGNSISFEARMYDPRLGRWLSMDALANKYPAVSPFAFALNTPIMAKDPDGNVVIFINGQHAGTGGTAAYWGGSSGKPGYDQRVMNAIGDHSARYVDGALGGWKNTGTNAGVGAFAGSRGGWIGSLAGAAFKVFNSSNVNMKVRMAAGAAQGMKDAADIIANLKEGETIKIVTHSMGTGFARGYTEGILKYAKAHGLADKVKFEYELDVNSFQGGDLPADKNVTKTQNKTGGLDGGNSLMEAVQGNSVPTVGKVPGAEDTSSKDDANKGHDVNQMSTDRIPNLGNGGNAGSVEQGSNNEKKP